MKMLNLGCGIKHRDGYINIDYVEPADLVLNVGKENLPYEDSSIDKIEADNLFEHLDNDEFLHIMNECHRVLKPNGTLLFIVPDALHWADGAFGDPTHKRFFVPRSFIYFEKGHPTYEVYGKSYGFKGWNKITFNTDNRFFTWSGNPAK